MTVTDREHARIERQRDMDELRALAKRVQRLAHTERDDETLRRLLDGLDAEDAEARS